MRRSSRYCANGQRRLSLLSAWIYSTAAAMFQSRADGGRQVTQLSDLGVLGLAVMGANLARNAARKGFGVALYIRHGGRTEDLVREFGHEGRFTPTKDLKAFVAALAKPRAVLIMVKAGNPVDDVIDELLPYLETDDIVIDGGNSLFTDTNRRFTALKEKKVRFIGMGVSGGGEGRVCTHRAHGHQDGGPGRRHAVLHVHRPRRSGSLCQDGA